jgi:hypothetical protein
VRTASTSRRARIGARVQSCLSRAWNGYLDHVDDEETWAWPLGALAINAVVMFVVAEIIAHG